MDILEDFLSDLMCSANSLENCSDCPLGHFCPLFVKEPIKCMNGYFQDEPGQNDCKICGVGHYCLNETFEIMCPEGTFQNDTRIG